MEGYNERERQELKNKMSSLLKEIPALDLINIILEITPPEIAEKALQLCIEEVKADQYYAGRMRGQFSDAD